MDEPFAALDEQTRLLLGDKVLLIQQELKQTTLLITHNLTEAVQLSDRVLVMTYRPGRLKRVVDIDLPHPRDSAVVSSEAFGHYVAQIWQDLREEASRGIREDETRVLARGADGDENRALGAFPRLGAPVRTRHAGPRADRCRAAHSRRHDQRLHRAVAIADRRRDPPHSR